MRRALANLRQNGGDLRPGGRDRRGELVGAARGVVRGAGLVPEVTESSCGWLMVMPRSV
jgi:hypothetical protein